MKKLIALSYFLIISLYSIAANKTIDNNLRDSFLTYFPNATEISWYELPDSYMVYFVNQGIQSRVLYSKDGSGVRLTRYYKEEYLSPSLLLVLKTKLPDLKLYGVTEVSTLFTEPDSQLTTEYFLTMEDAAKWYTVKMDSHGNITVLKKLKKAAGEKSGVVSL
jgi:hypothetical protein